MIADLVIPINGYMIDWYLEISFPRQVFRLEIEGCDAEVSEVEQTHLGGKHKGTNFVITPGPDSEIPSPGYDLLPL